MNTQHSIAIEIHHLFTLITLPYSSYLGTRGTIRLSRCTGVAKASVHPAEQADWGVGRRSADNQVDIYIGTRRKESCAATKLSSSSKSSGASAGEPRLAATATSPPLQLSTPYIASPAYTVRSSTRVNNPCMPNGFQNGCRDQVPSDLPILGRGLCAWA